MANRRDTLCFTCGLPSGDPLRLNHLPSGEVCPNCRDRLLDALPAPFPRVLREVPDPDEKYLAEPEPLDERPRMEALRPRPPAPPQDHGPEPA